jgi:hypothetical protein
MKTARTTLVVLAALALALAGGWGCKKNQAPGAADAAAQKDAPEPPPPPPPLHDAEVTLEGGWKIELRVPEGFNDDGKGTFQAPGNLLVVRASCSDPCEKGKLLARSADIVAQEIAGYAALDAAGNRIPPTIAYNNRVAEDRYEYEVTVPAGGGLLDEPALAGGVLLFNAAWPKYVVCEWAAGLQDAPTFKPALIDACKSIQVVNAAP